MKRPPLTTGSEWDVALALTLLVLFLIAARDLRLYRNYEFVDGHRPSALGEIDVFVRGEWRNTNSFPQVTHLESPYFLVVSLRTDEPVEGIVNIQVTRFLNGSKDVPQLKFAREEKLRPKCCREVGSIAAVDIRKIDLAFEELTVEGSVTLKGSVEKFSFTLKPKYSWEVHSDVFDAIMSV